jgi:DNA-binding transcriptional ArsR family regulator
MYVEISVDPVMVFKALSFPNRLNFLRLGLTKTVTATEASEELGVSLQAVGVALRALRGAGLIDAGATQRGVEAHYRTSVLGKKLLDAVQG